MLIRLKFSAKNRNASYHAAIRHVMIKEKGHQHKQKGNAKEKGNGQIEYEIHIRKTIIIWQRESELTKGIRNAVIRQRE